MPLNTSYQKPWIRIAKRNKINPKKTYFLRIGAIFLALLIGGLLILGLEENPFRVYLDILKGSLGNEISRLATLKVALPLLGVALALSLSFKMKFWNIGAEGQITMGAIFATYLALFHFKEISSFWLLSLMFLAALVGGGLWGAIPAFFKAKWNTNETLFTLMLNYIALGITTYLYTGPWKDPKGTFPKIAMFDQSARLPDIYFSLIFILLLTLVIFFYLNYSKQGYEIAVVGESPRTATYAGMKVSKIIIRTMFISGAISGIVGFLIISGQSYTLTQNTAGGYGFTAIAVAWLSRLNPFSMVIISLFLSILAKGANTIQTIYQIPSSVADILIGLILFFMLSFEFFIRYRLVFYSKDSYLKKEEK